MNGCSSKRNRSATREFMAGATNLRLDRVSRLASLRRVEMKIRRLLLDVDTAIQRPTPLELALALKNLEGVEGVNITVT
jgi:hypothetical protein